MKKFKKIAAMALSVITALSLFTGCDSKEETKTTDDSATLITIDDIKVPLSVGKFYAYNEQASYEAYYLACGYAINWSTIYENETDESSDYAGLTIEEVVKRDLLERIKMFYVVSEYAKSNNVTLTDEDRAEIDEYVNEYLAGSEKVINATKADEALLKQIYEMESYYNKGCDIILKDETFEVDDEEIRQTDVYAVELGPNYIEFPEDTANAILRRVQAGEDITKVANAYGLEAIEGNVGKGTFGGDSVEELCLSLSAGESGIAEEDGTYLVIYCVSENDEDATELAREEKISAMKSEKLEDFFKEYTKSMTISVDETLWETINYNTAIFTEADMEEILSDMDLSETATTTDETDTTAPAGTE